MFRTADVPVVLSQSRDSTVRGLGCKVVVESLSPF